VILVSHEGQLAGLVTVKDVLRHEASVAHRESKPPPTPSPNRNDSTESSNGWHDSWAGVDAGEEEANGLEIALGEAFAWLRIRGSMMYNVMDGLVRRARGRPREAAEHEAAYEFEMTEENRDRGVT